MLLGTGDAELIEDSPRDYFWGIGADKTGRNELGKALQRLRQELRHLPAARYDTNRFSVQHPTPLGPGNYVRRRTLSSTAVPLRPSASMSPGMPSRGNAEPHKHYQKEPEVENQPHRKQAYGTKYCSAG
ncbi:hypothetical protein ID866_7550 [Astraeus odoratus]|nr:hypothetical protein ID866_7550 [Astraeus odoratus]